jgi:FkbM family methyltransferase
LTETLTLFHHDRSVRALAEQLMDVFIDPRFESEYHRHPLVLVDVGARGGLKRNWAATRRHLRVIGFEPDSPEFSRLTAEGGNGPRSDVFLNVALHDRRAPLKLNVARDRGLSSIFEPDRSFIDAFPQADRFDTMDVQELQAETLDNVLESHAITDVDFIKADTQGSELLVLHGAARALASTVVGVEVEVEFTPIYREQPLFADVDAFMRDLGYQLFDLRPIYWKRSAGRTLGGPHGQIIWADALYMKGLPALRATVSQSAADTQKSKRLKAVSIALLYGYYDYALDIARDSAGVLAADERDTIERQLRTHGERHGRVPQFPGKRRVRGMLRRLWNLFRERDEGWAISGGKLGNPD